MDIWKTILDGYTSYANYLWNEIVHPTPRSYFYWLIGVSLFFFILEIIKPWRKDQKIFRKDFWLDFFYMFFNFFLFSLIVYNAASDVVVNLFNDAIASVTGGFQLQESNPLRQWPMWAVLITGFIVRDFVQWWVHRLLHRSEFLWQYHKVHHSVKEMGFAAHLRYHWMETIVYRSLEYIPLALLGIGLYDFFVIHIFTLAWGHYNHANFTVDARVTGGILGAFIGFGAVFGLADITLLAGQPVWVMGLSWLAMTLLGAFVVGPYMKIIFNSPDMHIWHHVEHLPAEKRYGVNFGITLAIWDYIFGTVHLPHSGRDEELGFPGVDEFPSTFTGQIALQLDKKS
jgi:sterol desaturase/sphingolipid hydroxylase (fatty acid hydroxylase superfamily)